MLLKEFRQLLPAFLPSANCLPLGTLKHTFYKKVWNHVDEASCALCSAGTRRDLLQPLEALPRESGRHPSKLVGKTELREMCANKAKTAECRGVWLDGREAFDGQELSTIDGNESLRIFVYHLNYDL